MGAKGFPEQISETSADSPSAEGELASDVVEIAGAIKWFDVSKGFGFDVPDDGICGERFSETGAIEGRRLDLG